MDQLFEDYDPLIQYVVSWTKWHFHPDVREDVAQTVRAELVKHIHRFKGGSSLKHFIKRVAIYRCIDEVRKQVRSRTHFQPMTVEHGGEEQTMEFAAGEEFDPIRQVEMLEQVAVMKSLLTDLTDYCQQAIHKFYYQGLSYKEIAAEFGITVNTVGSKLSKCLQNLRGTLAENAVFREYMETSNDK